MTHAPGMPASLCTLHLNTFKVNKTCLICSYRCKSSALSEKRREERREKVWNEKRDEEKDKGVIQIAKNRVIQEDHILQNKWIFFSKLYYKEVSISIQCNMCKETKKKKKRKEKKCKQDKVRYVYHMYHIVHTIL